MRSLLLFLALMQAALPAAAETQAAKKARYTKMVLSLNLDPLYVPTFMGLINNPMIYDTAAELTADTSQADGVLAYAADTDVIYLRMNSAWNNSLSAAGVLTLKNGGTFSNATNNAFIFAENSEDFSWTASTNMWTLDSSTSAAFTITPALTVTGAVVGSASVTTPIVASGHYVIRFCGNLPGSGTATTSYISPVGPATIVGGAANYEFGGSGCDGEDNATVGTADEVVTAVTMTPVALKCAAICTGGTTANDLNTFTVTDDGTAVTGGPSCTLTMAADATLYQCSSTLTPGATAIAGNSAIAIKMVNTNDDCDDAGDDVECFLTLAVTP